MAKSENITYVQEGQAPNTQITFDMLQGMIDALAERDYILNPKNFSERRARLEKILRAEQPVLPLEYITYEDIDTEMPEHRAIMTPDFTHLEGIFAVTEHLGEKSQPKPYTINGVKYMQGATGLTNLEKIIYHECGQTAQGDAVLPHEVHSQREWFRHAGGVRKKFNCTVEEAETLALAFSILDTTPRMAAQFAAWLTPEKFQKGYIWFQEIAKNLVLVTDEGEPKIIDTTQLDEDTNIEAVINADNPADIVMIQSEGWHKLDDPRDIDDPILGRPALWEDRQPAAFRQILAKIRGAQDLKALGAIGKELFNDKRFNKIQTTVIWDEYHRRKNNLSPKLRKLALTCLQRLADPKVNLNKVAMWLSGEGKEKLNKFELSVVWAAWKKLRGPKVKETSPMPQEEIPLDYNYDMVQFAYAE